MSIGMWEWLYRASVHATVQGISGKKLGGSSEFLSWVSVPRGARVFSRHSLIYEADFCLNPQVSLCLQTRDWEIKTVILMSVSASTHPDISFLRVFSLLIWLKVSWNHGAPQPLHLGVHVCVNVYLKKYEPTQAQNQMTYNFTGHRGVRLDNRGWALANEVSQSSAQVFNAESKQKPETSQYDVIHKDR